VLLHGVGSSASTWAELLALIDPGYTVVAPDYRGHGASEAPDGPYSLDVFVGDYFRLIDELGIGAAHIVGFSIGAIFAEAIALAQPDRAVTLTLLNSIGDRTEDERARALARLDVIRSTPPSEGAPASVARWFTPAFIAAQPALVQAELDIVSSTPHIPYAAAYEVLATSDLIDSVGDIACPVLLITGENDIGSTPRMSRAVHDKIAGSKLVVIDGLQHYLHIEIAHEIASHIHDFLGSHPAHHPVQPHRLHPRSN